MSALIDLAAYSQEVEAFVALAAEFVDKNSALRLADIERDLNTGVGAGAAKWSWETRDTILFQPSTAYDGPGKAHVETFLELTFKFVFERPVRVRKRSTVWKIASAATHLLIRKEGGGLPFHFDYKNSGQWGPQLHFQVAETLGGLPIPRIPSPTFLPTDCIDLALAELHHEDWRRRQAAGANSRHVSLIRRAQENRTKTYLRNIASLWDGDTSCTRVCMLQEYTATVTALPDQHNRTPVW